MHCIVVQEEKETFEMGKTRDAQQNKCDLNVNLPVKDNIQISFEFRMAAPPMGGGDQVMTLTYNKRKERKKNVI